MVATGYCWQLMKTLKRLTESRVPYCQILNMMIGMYMIYVIFDLTSVFFCFCTHIKVGMYFLELTTIKLPAKAHVTIQEIRNFTF